MTPARMLIVGLVGLLAVGCGGGAKKPSKKKHPKKSDGGAAAAKAIGELRDWAEENQADWKGFRERAAALKKKYAKSSEALKDLAGLQDERHEFTKSVLLMKVDKPGKTYEAPGNEQYWEKYLGELTAVEKELADFDPAVAKEQASKIADWRTKIIDGVFKSEVEEYCDKNRTDAAAVAARLTEWRGRLEKLGDLATKKLAELDEIEKSTAEIAEWMKRVPPGPVNLLAPEHRAAWEKLGDVDVSWEGDVMVVTGTGGSHKERGSLLHKAFWWTDFEAEVTFEIVESGWCFMGRASTANKAGYSEFVTKRGFPEDHPYNLSFKLTGDTGELGGAVAPTPIHPRGDGGGIGILMSGGAKVRILKFDITPTK